MDPDRHLKRVCGLGSERPEQTKKKDSTDPPLSPQTALAAPITDYCSLLEKGDCIHLAEGVSSAEPELPHKVLGPVAAVTLYCTHLIPPVCVQTRDLGAE